MNRRPIQLGEALAIDPKAIQREADSIFVLFSPDVPKNEYSKGVACVHIRGPLDHHAGCGDNYDAIRERAREAFECEEAHAVIFRIDSPGGAVSGLLDTVRALRLMAESSDKRTIAYVDERAFSAAYALACACDEIVLPESGLCGSIGVISTMADQVQHDKDLGFNFVTITSGARKADGHIHVPISEDAVAAERVRVDALAEQFFQSVKESRGLSLKTIRGFEAGLFLGFDAETAGVADRVMTFDQLFAELAQDGALDTPDTHESAFNNGDTMTGYRAQLLEQLKAAKATVAKATGLEKTKAEVRVETLAAQLEAYKKVTEKHVEHSKTHEEDEGDEDEEGNETDRDDDEEGDEEKDDKEAASAKKSTKTAGKSKARMQEEDEEEEANYAEDEEEAKALVSIVRGATGKRGAAAQGALAAIVAKAKDSDRLATRLAKIEQERADEKRDAIIDAAKAAHRLTPAEAKDLRKRPMAYVEAFLAARPQSVVFATTSEMPIPAPVPGGMQAKLPPDLQKQLDMASAAGIPTDKILEDYQRRSDAMARKQNGAA